MLKHKTNWKMLNRSLNVERYANKFRETFGSAVFHLQEKNLQFMQSSDIERKSLKQTAVALIRSETNNKENSSFQR